MNYRAEFPLRPCVYCGEDTMGKAYMSCSEWDPVAKTLVNSRDYHSDCWAKYLEEKGPNEKGQKAHS